jgi:mono/diheme cytochrome c family protein
VDGSGKQIRAAMPRIPDFSSLAWQMSQTDLEIAHRIQDGNEPTMPAYRDKLSQQQILALTIYVRAFSVVPVGTSAPPATPPNASGMPVGLLYRNYCLSCHDADGRGLTFRKAMPEIPDFTDRDWNKSRRDTDFLRAILEGKGETANEFNAGTVGLLGSPLGHGPWLASSLLLPGRPKGRFMVPMKDRLSPADAERLVKYVRSFQEGKPPDSVEPPTPVVPPPPTKPVVVVPDDKKPPTAEVPDTANRIRAATGLYRQYCLICHGTDGKGRELKASMPTIPDFTTQNWQNGVSDVQLGVSILEGKGTLMPAFRGRVTDEETRDLTAYVRAFGPATPPPPPGKEPTDYEKNFRDLQEQWNELQRQLDKLSKPPPKP